MVTSSVASCDTCWTKTSSSHLMAFGPCPDTIRIIPIFCGSATTPPSRAERRRRIKGAPGLFGGNSNWRGPGWFPVNFLIIESLQKFHHFLGDDFKVECPVGSGHMMNLWEVAAELSRRLIRIFLRDSSGRRPVNGETEKFQTDHNWRDLILFYEYFNGDTGAGLGASHQT